MYNTTLASTEKKTLTYTCYQTYSKDLAVAMTTGRKAVQEHVTEEWAMQHFAHIAAGIEAGLYELLELRDNRTIVRSIKPEPFQLDYIILERRLWE